MRIAVLASGSKGNVTYIESEQTKLLIDIGMPINYVEEKLNELNVDASEINAILLTHTHTDHISGLRKFSKKYKPNIYIFEGMDLDITSNDNYCVIKNKKFKIGDIDITTVPTSHDINISNGFVIEHNCKELVYVTDTGYINIKHFESLKNKDAYIFESNHDVEMLMTGSYPYHLKQRIISDSGHLSNDTSSLYLSQFVGDRTKCIVLSHISEKNNLPQLAYDTLIEKLAERDKSIEKIIVASQNTSTELIEI